MRGAGPCLVVMVALCGWAGEQAQAARSRRQSRSFELGHQDQEEDPDACVPPAGGAGRCVAVQLCPEIFAILSSRPIPSHQFAFLRRSICRRDANGRPMFCCARQPPPNVVFNPGQPLSAATGGRPTTTLSSTSSPTSTATTSTPAPTTAIPAATLPPATTPTLSATPSSPPPTTTSTPAPTEPAPTDPPATIPQSTEPPATSPQTEPPTVLPTEPPREDLTIPPTPPSVVDETTFGSNPFMLSTTPNIIEETTMIVISDSAGMVEETGGSSDLGDKTEDGEEIGDNGLGDGGDTSGALETDEPVEVDHAGPAILPRISECGNTDAVLPRIVGGRFVGKHDWPWIAALGYADGRGEISFSCGATLITRRHVLTAAHCIKGQPSLRVVRLGEHDLAVDTEAAHEDYTITRKIVHEGYDTNFQNDIAILELDRDVVFRKQMISPICLPQPEFFTNMSLVGFRPFVTGWGSVEYNKRSSDILKDVAVTIMETELCESNYAKFKTLTVDHKTICAGDRRGGKDACQGDSGGPLILPSSYQRRSKYFLVGVVSLGYKCAEAEFPGIYSRVSYFLPWIYDNLV